MGRRRVQYQKRVKQFVRTHADATVGSVTGRIASHATERKGLLHRKWASQAGVKP